MTFSLFLNNLKNFIFLILSKNLKFNFALKKMQKLFNESCYAQNIYLEPDFLQLNTAMPCSRSCIFSIKLFYISKVLLNK